MKSNVELREIEVYRRDGQPGSRTSRHLSSSRSIEVEFKKGARRASEGGTSRTIGRNKVQESSEK